MKYVDIESFGEFGYLQEVNRRFFHPLGLALEIVVDGEGNMCIGGIQDFRDDPEGMYFTESVTQKPEWIEKYKRVEHEWNDRAPSRLSSLGYMVQPIEEDK